MLLLETGSTTHASLWAQLLCMNIFSMPHSAAQALNTTSSAHSAPQVKVSGITLTLQMRNSRAQGD